jgi:hypothetical protein
MRREEFNFSIPVIGGQWQKHFIKNEVGRKVRAIEK